MTVFGRYRVIGKRPYRGHQPGDVFEAALDPGPESRAIQRGDIELLERTTPRVQEGSYAFPEGWPDPPGGRIPNPPREARVAGLSRSGGR